MRLWNFGDALNPVLFERLLPGLLDEDRGTVVLGIGSGLARVLPRFTSRRDVVVLGAGAGYVGHRLRWGRGFPREALGVTQPVGPPGASTCAYDTSRVRFYFVRGPLTARFLGLEPELAIGDPALLTSRLSWGPVQRTGRPAFMPHVSTAARADLRPACEQLGIDYVDPRDDVASVMQQIRASDVLITEALHGAVVADSFRVPWTPVFASGWVLQFKWRDFSSSLGLPYAPLRIYAPWNAERLLDPPQPVEASAAMRRALRARTAIENLRNRGRIVPALRRALDARPLLSDESRLEGVCDRMQRALERFRSDVSSARARATASPP